MGNCQAAEAATVIIQHPGGTVERLYWSVSASEVMGSNPGHYVAVVVTAPPLAAAGTRGAGAAPDVPSAPVRQLKLLRPDDTLHIGQVYRLISFEEVLKEFAAKKHGKLSKLLLTQQQQEEKRVRGSSARRGRDGTSRPCENSSVTAEHQRQQHPSRQGEEEDDAHPTTISDASASSMISLSSGRLGGGAGRHGQWRPSLQSISEAGS